MTSAAAAVAAGGSRGSRGSAAAGSLHTYIYIYASIYVIRILRCEEKSKNGCPAQKNYQGGCIDFYPFF